MRSCMFLGNGRIHFALFVLSFSVPCQLGLLVGLFVFERGLGRVQWLGGGGRRCLQGSDLFVLCGMRSLRIVGSSRLQ